MSRPHLIAIAGASGAGKTTLAGRLAEVLGATGSAAPIVPLDAYYRDHPGESPAVRAARNFDAPEALETALLFAHLEQLRNGRAAERPTYDFRTHRRTARAVVVQPAPYVVVEGLLALHWAAVRNLCATKIFLAIDDDLALARRIARDTSTRGRTVASVRQQWSETVHPMFRRYVEPTRRFADLTVDGAAPVEATVAAVLAFVRPAGRVP
ncbi:MAG: uridine kinase [Acidobacteria bacterium]|nr:uridine kinase [Acidobacteriota bacterium]